MGPIRDMLSDAGITEQQWRVLRVLDENGPSDPTRISESACLLLPSLTRILQKLEEKEMISRTRDKDDGRRQVIRIADEGKKIIDDNRDAALALTESLRSAMGAERYELLLDLLNDLDQVELRQDS